MGRGDLTGKKTIFISITTSSLGEIAAFRSQ